MEISRPPSSRPMSRRGPSTEMSSASSGRIGTASKLSALSGYGTRIGTAKNIGIPQKGLVDRPLTQQGLSGLSTAQGRLGTASGMRQVKDKRYWMALLQSKIQEIALETEKLDKERKNLERETSAKKLYEKKVREQAKEFSVLQSTLSDMNLALDSSSTGATRQQLQNETLVYREKNELMQNELEHVFKERQNKESQNQQLESAIANEKTKMNEIIYSLSLDEQNRYREHQLLCEKLKAENAEIHEKIESFIKQKEKLSAAVINSQARLEAVKMHSKLRETTAKRNQLKNEETNRLTPAQEREKLINEVRTNNQAITSINKQLKILSDQLQEKRNNLQQVEQDLDEGSTERHIKYKELKKRDEMMTNFMETFQIQMAKEKQNVESLKNQITFLIEQITLQGVNSKFSTSNIQINSSAFNENNDLNSHSGLLKEYSKLQVQLKQLKILEKRMMKQLDDLRQDEKNLLEDIQKFNNLNVLRDEYAVKYEELSTNLQELKDKKRVTENVVQDSERRNQAIKESLRNNETYRQIQHMEEKLNDFIKDNKLLQRIVDELNSECDFSTVKIEAQRKVDEYNKLLCADLRSQNTF
ncbi:CLUMA_CG013206, isoform A [Clunio marinus]|uniref:CLUMA_CG013206, isoform A n=1 Tax=Clunio marinus TaxID=568069 RepID=A0A1J1II15_9DIPT|nr:CLUMA_CG013206, isoform A [Clunio marinus]